MDTELASSIERLHTTLTRFNTPSSGLLLDFAPLGSLPEMPDASECEEGKPNLLGWFGPLENGTFFSGLYLDALCRRAQRTHDVADAVRARAIMRGLLLVASVGSTPGFIARNVTFDGHSHYPLGSDDQTFPWFYGLWCYDHSGIASKAEHAEIVDAVSKVGSALERANWMMPSDSPRLGPRGAWGGADARDASRLLATARILTLITGSSRWIETYNALAQARPAHSLRTRLELCYEGVSLEQYGNPRDNYWQLWIKAGSQAAIRLLRDTEQDPVIREHLDSGLRAFAAAAAPQISRYKEFQNDVPGVYDTNWRRLNEVWKPQTSIVEALAVAETQGGILWSSNPRKRMEDHLMREPLFACWIVALSGDHALIEANRAEIDACLEHFQWEKLCSSTCFVGECAYYELLDQQP